MLCQCKVISCNQCTTVVGDVDSGKAIREQGLRGHEKSLYLMCSFAMYRTALKKISLKHIYILELDMIGCPDGLDMEVREKKETLK